MKARVRIAIFLHMFLLLGCWKDSSNKGNHESNSKVQAVGEKRDQTSNIGDQTSENVDQASENGDQASEDGDQASETEDKPGGETDAHGCKPSTGSIWCGKENKCVQAWDLKIEGVAKPTAEDVEKYCSVEAVVMPGGDTDAHGCKPSTGFSWCGRENKCVQAGGLKIEGVAKPTAEDVEKYCSTDAVDTLGGDRDAHGCIPSAGFSWCGRENKCVRAEQLEIEGKKGVSAEKYKEYCGQ